MAAGVGCVGLSAASNVLASTGLGRRIAACFKKDGTCRRACCCLAWAPCQVCCACFCGCGDDSDED